MANDSKFREDIDLAFLQDADYRDLKLLADYLIKDSTGTEQWTGQLKQTIRQRINEHNTEEEAYKNSWMAIAAELQLYGGDTLANLVRSKGVVYKEVVQDVAEKIGADFHKELANTKQIEEKVLRKLFNRITTFDDLEFINETLKNKGYLGLSSLSENPWETLKNSLGGGAASAGGLSSVLFAGFNLAKNVVRVNPAVAAATLPLTVKDITAPAYRVTIPAVCIVAMMRIKHDANPNKNQEF